MAPSRWEPLSVSQRSLKLRQVYPVVVKLVGEPFFNQAATNYIVSHPSTSGDLNDYGGEFAGFLRDYAPASHLEYLAGVAALEWAIECAYHAADASPLDFAALGRVPPESYGGLRFTLHPAVRLMQSPFPVDRIWRMHQPGETIEPIERAEVHLLVTRRDNEPQFESIDRAEFAWLSALHAGEPLSAAVERALLCDAGFALQETLSRRVMIGDIAGFSVD